MGEKSDLDDELSFRDFRQQLQQLRIFLNNTLKLLTDYTKRYWLLVFILLAGFSGLGYYKYKESRVFEAKASFVYEELQKKTYGEMLEKLDYMVQSGSYGKVADALSLSREQARSILAIEAQNMYGAKLSEDITETQKLFYVNVVATKGQIFDSLPYALEHYLNNNVRAKELVDKHTKILQQKIAHTKEDLIRLDSLKVAYNHSLDKPSSALYPSGSPFNPVLIYDKGEKMLHDLTTMQALLDDYRIVRTQDKFMVTEMPYGKSAMTFAIKYFAFFLASCIALFFLLSIFRK